MFVGVLLSTFDPNFASTSEHHSNGATQMINNTSSVNQLSVIET